MSLDIRNSVLLIVDEAAYGACPCGDKNTARLFYFVTYIKKSKVVSAAGRGGL
jgi:hypothetical protein